MAEQLSPRPISPEVQITRTWMKKIIIENGLCPPLTNITQSERDMQGRINWDSTTLSKQIAITSYRASSQPRDVLSAQIRRRYFTFLTNAAIGAAPLANIYIFPDFGSNQDYNTFMDEMKRTTGLLLSSNPLGQDSAQKIYQQSEELRGVNSKTIEQALNSGPDSIVHIASHVIEHVLSPIRFYLRDLTNEDIASFPYTSALEERERQKILSRAPLYMALILNTLVGKDLTSDLDRRKLREHNTRWASTMDPRQYGIEMDKLRNTFNVQE